MERKFSEAQRLGKRPNIKYTTVASAPSASTPRNDNLTAIDTALVSPCPVRHVAELALAVMINTPTKNKMI
jgi:hypothetical protein